MKIFSRPSRDISKLLRAVLTITVIVVIYEGLPLLAINADQLFSATLGFALIVGVVYTAIRYGLRPGLLAAILSNIYLLYALSGPGRNFVPIENMLRGEWLILLIYFAPAIIIGYLRDRIDDLINREKEARIQAEQGERRLAHILQQMPVGIVIAKAPDGQITFSNDHLDKIMGHQVKKVDGYDHYPANKLIDKEGQPLKQNDWPIFRVINNQEQLINEEFYYANEEATSVFKVNGVPIYDDNNNLDSGLVIIDDITAEKELEQKKDDFISMISHELKTPITSLKIYTQFLLKKVNNNNFDDLPQSLNKINEQADKLQRLVNSMLYIAQTKTGKLEYQLDNVNISAILRTIIDDAKMIIPDHPIKFSCQQNVIACVDVDRFSQVIINLITNAAKYSPPGTDIEVRLTSEDNSATISIRDYGVGISQKDIDRVFDRFYQATRTNGHAHGGLGIGLYLASDIIKQHNGDIWVDSHQNKGSTFTISLPLAKSP